MISADVSGSFRKTESFLINLNRINILHIMDENGKLGVKVLSEATPIETRRAASSWGYEVGKRNNIYTITWTNSDIENGFPVVIMLQYGYGTGTGGYVQGRDFINPAIKPIFDRIANSVWKAVTSA